MTPGISHQVIAQTPNGTFTHLRLSGTLDETFPVDAIKAELQGFAVLSLGQVARISSFGVRKWMELMKAPRQRVLCLQHVPPVFVDQLNMVEGFSGNAQVLSFLAPYECTNCGLEQLRVVDLTQGDVDPTKPPEHTCAACGSPAKFSELWSEFCDFVAHQKRPILEPVVARYLGLLRADVSEAVPVVKLVDGDVTYVRLSQNLTTDLNVRKLSAGLEGTACFDFGAVVGFDEAGVAKLGKALAQAAEAAQVHLWRLPAELLAPMKPTQALQLGSVMGKFKCGRCSQVTRLRMTSEQYIASTKGTGPAVNCEVCAGDVAVQPANGFLGAVSLVRQSPAALTQKFASFEPKALATHLAGGASEITLNRTPSLTDLAVDSGAKLAILRRLGRGGMADVFLARQQGLKGFEKYVVVKKVLETFAGSAEFVEMLFAEARANARLTHPNIVQTYDVGLMNGVAYISMEYVRGPDVKRMIKQLKSVGKNIPLPQALRITAETAAGLQYAHSYVDPTGVPHPMVHRDVSPHNILISLDGAVKLSDFGIAKVLGEGERTMPGTFKGKIAYASPEAIAGRPLDGRNDVFALGVSLFEMLTGQLPFKRESEVATLQAILRDAPPDLNRLVPNIPSDVVTVVMKALEKDPNRRVATAGQLQDEIEAVMARNQLSCSPNNVARFCVENLGPLAAEYLPEGQVPGATPPPSMPQPSLAAIAQPPPPQPQEESISMSNVEMEEEAPPPRQASGAPYPNNDDDEGSTLAVTPSSLRQQRLEQVIDASLPPAAAPVAAPPPTRREVAHKPVDKSAPPVPSQPRLQSVQGTGKSGLNAAVVPPAPDPSRTPSQSLPTVNTKSPIAPVSSPALANPEAVTNPESMMIQRGGGPSLGVIVGIALAVLLAIAGIAMWFSAEGGGVKGLAADEQLFIDGIAVEPKSVVIGEQTSIVAVAKAGKLVRFGSATGSLDTSTLPKASANFGQKANISVRTPKPGCKTQLGTTKGATPFSASIDTGTVMELEVLCEGAPRWARTLLAVPGQSIDLSTSP